MPLPSARMPLPYFIVQGLDYTIECPLWRDGEIVPVVGGMISIFDGHGAPVVQEDAVDPGDDGVARYTVPGVVTSPLPRGIGWRVEWSLETAAGVQPRIVNEAALVRTELRPVITDEDIARRVPNLDPRSDRAVVDLPASTWQPYIDEAWVQLQGRLLASGVRPNLIITSSALREVHLLMTLALIYEDLSVTRGDTHAEQALDRRRQAESQWRTTLQMLYDANDDGRPDQKRSPVGSFWLMGWPSSW